MLFRSIVAKEENMDIVTGINIPMLLGVFSAREDLTVDKLAQIAISTGQMGMKSLKKTLKNTKENEKKSNE